MFRIAHISDLHIQAPESEQDEGIVTILRQVR
jgi:hypothetical protein